MFALDNILRTGAEAAIAVLSPELSEDLVHSSPSTVNSAKSSKNAETNDLRDKYLQVKAENSRLLQQLLESQKQYQNMVRIFFTKHLIKTFMVTFTFR